MKFGIQIAPAYSRQGIRISDLVGSNDMLHTLSIFENASVL